MDGWMTFIILVPRGRAPFGQHQESRPLAESNNGSQRFMDFPSLCTCSESSLTNLIGSGLNLLFTNPFKTGMSLDQARGRDSWCWPKGARPLGTRMEHRQWSGAILGKVHLIWQGGGNEDIEGGLQKFLDTWKRGSEKILFTSKPTGGVGEGGGGLVKTWTASEGGC